MNQRQRRRRQFRRKKIALDTALIVKCSNRQNYRYKLNFKVICKNKCRRHELIEIDLIWIIALIDVRKLSPSTRASLSHPKTTRSFAGVTHLRSYMYKMIGNWYLKAKLFRLFFEWHRKIESRAVEENIKKEKSNNNEQHYSQSHWIIFFPLLLNWQF